MQNVFITVVLCMFDIFSRDILCLYRAAELMTRTGSVVTLEVAKQGAIYHGLATLLNQPSPMMQRGKLAARLRHKHFLTSSRAGTVVFFWKISVFVE